MKVSWWIAIIAWLVRKVRRQFLAGILVMVPLGVTILILVWLFRAIDNTLQPVIHSIAGRSIPGVGLGVTLVLIYLAGVTASNILGRRLIHYGESLLARLPVFKQLYSTIKEIFQSFSGQAKDGFGQVVLVEFPKKDMRALGFVTKETRDEAGHKLLFVFIPTTPNPTSGFLEIVHEEEVIRTSISVSDAMKMIVSAGRVSPNEVSEKLSLHH